MHSVIFVIAWVLQNDEGELFLWGDHNLMLLGPDSNEINILFGVERFDS